MEDITKKYMTKYDVSFECISEIMGLARDSYASNETMRKIYSRIDRYLDELSEINDEYNGK